MKKYFLILASLLVMNTANASLEEIFGNAEPGDNCTSDYQCASLCCHQNTETCGEHQPSENKFCAKQAGERCITNDYCETYKVITCNLYKNGTKADGSPACVVRCPEKLVKGNCKNEICIPPLVPPIPNYDPNDCSSAIDP